MSTWMARFLDGPYEGQTRQVPEPFEELIVVATEIHGVIGVDAAAFDALADRPRHWEPARYRRTKMSKLADDDPMIQSGLMVRGAEYELVSFESIEAQVREVAASAREAFDGPVAYWRGVHDEDGVGHWFVEIVGDVEADWDKLVDFHHDDRPPNIAVVIVSAHTEGATVFDN